MNDLCFMSGLTSSEWAAWVQAIGSILAILASAGFVIWQHHLSFERDKALVLDRHRETVETYASVVGESISLLKKLEAHAASGTVTVARDYEHLIHQFIAAEELLRTCTSDDMKSASIPVLMQAASVHFAHGRNDLFRDFAALERSESLEPGLDPHSQLTTLLGHFDTLRREIEAYDTSRSERLKR